MKFRRFTQDFKRSLVELLLSETGRPAELAARVRDLECLLGKVTLEAED